MKNERRCENCCFCKNQTERTGECTMQKHKTVSKDDVCKSHLYKAGVKFTV